MEANVVEFNDAFPYFPRTESSNTGLIVPKEALMQMMNPVDTIVSLIKDEKIDFPFKRFNMTVEDADEMFKRARDHVAQWSTEPYKLNKTFDDDPLFPPQFFPIIFENNVAVGAQVTTYVMDVNSNDLYLSVNMLPDFFIEPSRVKAYRTGMSVYNAWFNNDKFLNEVVATAIKNSPDGINPHSLREAIYEIHMFQECPHERVTFTVDMFRLLTQHIRDDILIFDPCAGYGDRLLATMAMKALYVGVEPNSESQFGFREMIERYGDPKRHIMLEDYMPDAKLPEVMKIGADLAMISPPSFDSEKYSDDEGQSISIYPDRDEWLVKFLFRTIHRTISLLKNNRYLIIQSILAKEINAYIYLRFTNMVFIGDVTVSTGCRNKPMHIWLKTNDFRAEDLKGWKRPNRAVLEQRFSLQVLDQISKDVDTEYPAI